MKKYPSQWIVKVPFVWVAVLLVCVPLSGISQPAEQACFSVSGGFYDTSPTLEIFPFYQQHHIRYTTNGNRPTAQSPLYTGPLLLNESLYSASDIYKIQISTDDFFFVPDSVRHCIVIRAAVFDQNDNCISDVATNSYFIRSLGCDTHGLPVVSLCADSLDLFDDQHGILVPGVTYDPLSPQNTGNYYQTGLEWERLANVEYYDQSPEAINQFAGLRTQGLKSRRFEQKALKLYAREEYGQKRFKHRFFETIPNDSFKRLVLKPFYASFSEIGVTDYLTNRIASSLNLETLASSPVVLFLNGEYWGIYFIHEKPDEHYLEDHLGVDSEQVTILSGWDPIVDCGNPQNYLELFDWMSEADLSDPQAYAYAASKIDIDNFIDYYIFELFWENTDWPNNNMRCWQNDNGKWRWIFFDGDACMCWMSYNAFDFAIYEGDETWPSSTKASLFFRKLFVNKDFKQQFNARFMELINTAFNYANTEPLFEEIKARVADEIPFQSERFGKPSDMESWNADLERSEWFLKERGERILTVLENFMNWPLLDQPMKFTVYPNPISDEIHLFVDSDRYGYEQIAIYDLLGKQVYSQWSVITQGINELSIQLDLAAGIYVLRIGGQAAKLVKQ